MDHTKASPDGGLEAQLRGMILGNVRIGGDQVAQGDRRSQHGRGRGRGGSWRGANRVYHNRTSQTEAPSATQPSVPASARRECRTGLQHHGTRHSSQGHANSYNHQHRDASALPHSPTAQGSYRNLRPARQPHHNQPQDDQNAAHPSSTSTLQKPHHPNAQPTTDHINSGSRHHPHTQVPQQHLPRFHESPESTMAQIKYLDAVAAQEIPRVEMSLSEFEEKELFRQRLEATLKQYFSDHYSGDIATIFLVGFGSLASGFGMPGSDMDLAVVPEWKDPSKILQIEIDREIPRLLEQAILDARMGGRLLTRTRVPILKVCQKPPEALYAALVEERQKWDSLPEDEKYPTEVAPEPPTEVKLTGDADGTKAIEHAHDGNFEENFPAIGAITKGNAGAKSAASTDRDLRDAQDKQSTPPAPPSTVTKDTRHSLVDKEQQPRTERPWMREKILGPLDFPKTGCGIQCDLNFGNPLGIHNTHMLHCYSLTDPRVRPIVLFVKSWAKQRKINSAYSGTLSSYGWVLMVLHYLVNIAQPPVCPNLQLSVPQPKDVTQLESFFKDTVIAGYTVRFWRDEQEIINAAQAGRLSQNRQSVGSLLRGFFQYYASLSRYGPGSRQPQFFWTSEVLSLRTPGGIRSKQEKGWVSAKTTITAEKKVTNRYLFAIEDPFELDHNVARTVTHRGIVAIRDELRRAWNILVAIGREQIPEGGLFDDIKEALPYPAAHDGTAKEYTRSEEEGLATAKGQSVDVIATENPL